jgi:hypothetical protein
MAVARSTDLALRHGSVDPSLQGAYARGSFILDAGKTPAIGKQT